MKKQHVLFSLFILFAGFFAMSGCSNSTPDYSSEKTILSYSVTINNEVYEGTIDNNKHEILISDVPYNSDITALVPVFTISKKASITINAVPQTSNVSTVDFSNGVIYYTVTAEDKTQMIWTVKITKAQPVSYTIKFHKNIPNSTEDEVIVKSYNENYIFTFPSLENLINYNFTGWALTSDATVVAYQADSSYTVTNNIDFYAVWSLSKKRYVINYYTEETDGSYPDNYAQSFISSGEAGTALEYNISDFPDFTVDEEKTGTATIAEDGSTVWKVYLKRKTASYKINYYKEALDETYSETEDKTVSSTGKFGLTIEYDISEFTGFELDTTKTKATTIEVNGSSIQKVYLKRKTASYTVNFYKEALDGTYSETKDSTVTLSGKFGAQAEYDISEFTGFELDEEKTQNATIKADSSTIVNVFLKRKTVAYTVKYLQKDENGEILNQENKVLSGKFGAAVQYDDKKYAGYEITSASLASIAATTIKADGTTSVTVEYRPVTITIYIKHYYADLDGNYSTTPDYSNNYTTNYNANYSISASVKEGFTPNVESISIADAVKEGNNYTFSFNYTRNTMTYTVKYFLENANNNLYTEQTSAREEKTGLFGAQLVYQQKTIEHAAFDSVEYSTTNGTIGTNSFVSVYYKRDTVKFTYKWNNGNVTDTEVTYKYGQSVTAPSSGERVLYKFNGWNPSLPETATEIATFEATWETLAGTTDTGAPTFIIDLPETIYVKTPVQTNTVYLNAYVTNNITVSYSLYSSNDGITWASEGNSRSASGQNKLTIGLPITLPDENSEKYYCMRISDSFNSTDKYSYSKICRITTKTADTENIGKFYYSDGTYTSEYDSSKTVIGIVSNLKADKTPKTIIPVSLTTTGAQFTNAKSSCDSYSKEGFDDWELPDYIELQSILFNKQALNNSLTTINSSASVIQGYTSNKPLFYWASQSTNNLTNNTSFSLYLYSTESNIYELQIKSFTLSGYYIPVLMINE